MGYHIGKYRTHDGSEYNLVNLDHGESKLFRELMAAYESATSWKEFQDLTAKKTLEFTRERMKKSSLPWENYYIYKIRFDMLRNVGIRMGELKGELSDMLID